METFTVTFAENGMRSVRRRRSQSTYSHTEQRCFAMTAISQLLPCRSVIHSINNTDTDKMQARTVAVSAEKLHLLRNTHSKIILNLQ